MRIACVLDLPLPSREMTAVQVLQTLAALSRLGADVSLFVPVGPRWSARHEPPTPETLRAAYGIGCDFALHTCASLWPGGRKLEKLLHAILATSRVGRRRYDVLYTRNVLPALGGILLGQPTVFETYRPLPWQFPSSRRLLKRAAARRACLGIVTHSELARSAFVEAGLPPRKVKTVHNGFDAAAFSRAVTAFEARKALGLPERPTVCYAGRIAPLKRVDLVLAAAARMSEAQFVMAGALDAAEAEPLAREARRLGVILPGFVTGERLALVLQAADVLIIPPSREPLERHGNTVLPLKAFEYLAAGRPIVTGEVEDTAELLRHGETALRVPPDDVAALTAALRGLLADPARRDAMGRAARQRAQGLDWTARGERLLAFMRERLDAPHGSAVS
ncbi:MAG: glycosyltransferase family 4 protein [Deltaproteobacteria bacterium]|nr:glycosyltransferase family 4 protein [Deltaproteobacteria bacterium]